MPRSSARRSVSRVLCRSTPKRRLAMAIHLRPSVARRLMRPTRGLGSAPLPRPVARHGLRPPIWPCSGWSLPVSLRPRPEGRPSASSLWHWSSSHDGRVLPATLRWGARTFLTARAGRPDRPRDHPTASLTSQVYPGRPADDRCRHHRPAWHGRWPRWRGRRRRVLGARHVGRRPPREAVERRRAAAQSG